MNDLSKAIELRIEFIKKLLKDTGAKGVIFGNSGGKDSALVGILCKKACPNVLAVMLPCHSQQNYGQDMIDAKELARKYEIESLVVDLSKTKENLLSAIAQPVTKEASANIAPRLRMTTLYSIAQSRGYLVAGTGNRSEIYMGYFTKWGDGAYDFNPIADLTATEIFQYLKFIDAPASIIDKAPSAGLYQGQTDEQEMGIKYKALDHYLLTGQANPNELLIYQKAHQGTNHKRQSPIIYKNQ